MRQIGPMDVGSSRSRHDHGAAWRTVRMQPPKAQRTVLPEPRVLLNLLYLVVHTLVLEAAVSQDMTKSLSGTRKKQPCLICTLLEAQQASTVSKQESGFSCCLLLLAGLAIRTRYLSI